MTQVYNQHNPQSRQQIFKSLGIDISSPSTLMDNAMPVPAILSCTMVATSFSRDSRNSSMLTAAAIMEYEYNFCRHEGAKEKEGEGKDDHERIDARVPVSD